MNYIMPMLLPILYNTDMLSLVDGTSFLPNEYIESFNESDQLFLSWLHATLTSTIFAQVVGYTTVSDTWQALERAFTSLTNARLYQVRHELSYLRKFGSHTTTSLTKKTSFLCINGLGIDYDSLNTSVTTSPEIPSFEALYSMLFNREKRSITHPSPYNGQEHIVVENGNTLPINCSGTIYLHTHLSSFKRYFTCTASLRKPYLCITDRHTGKLFPIKAATSVKHHCFAGFVQRNSTIDI
ncbi:hypothetical protein AMTRI_Chr06g195000 [Amborella trichopoda]